MSAKKMIKTGCVLCHAGCGLLVHVENGEIVRIEGDPECPVCRGNICLKAKTSLEQIYHPDRLKHPLRRSGQRGGGKWERISWDEALDTVAEGLVNARETYGPESVVFMRGSFKGAYEGGYLTRFANAFGSPNVSSMASVCWIPRVYGSVMTLGFDPVVDYEYPPTCIMVWGSNMPETRLGEGIDTLKVVREGGKLIVVDPRKFELSRKADVWLQVRPGSDLALALGHINVIIKDNLYDKSFVEKWTVGFDELRQHIEQYTPEEMEKITWVPANLIRDAARLYATSKPAIIQPGNGIDHNGNNFQIARALTILRAITGNVGIPGGELSWSQPPIVGMRSPEFDLRDRIPKTLRDKRLDVSSGLLPMSFGALPQSIVKAVLKGEPYRLHAAYILGGNMLLTYSNAKEVYKAFQQIDFLAVADMFMTPTVAMADIVLPVSSYLEQDGVVVPDCFPLVQVQQKVAQVGECRSDLEIFTSLAKKIGAGECFWESEIECLDFIMRPSGLTFDEFRKVGRLVGAKEYRKHEKDGFATPSKKVELYSQRLKDWGFDPLPTYREAPETPMSAPELATEYPLIFTSWKVDEFRHAGGRQIESLRKRHPEPVIWIHPDTAAGFDIRDGDAVYIETKRGRIQQKALLTADIDRRVVGVDYGWWFPEKGSATMYGWADANVNILTDDAPPWGKELGTPSLRGILCKVYRASV